MGAREPWWGLSGDAKVNVALLKPLQVPQVGESRAAMIVGPRGPRGRRKRGVERLLRMLYLEWRLPSLGWRSL